MMISGTPRNVAEPTARCLEAEGVTHVFGIPGKENIHLVSAIGRAASMRFILTRHERAAALMTGVYGRLAGQAGVCTATLGPGAINLLLEVTDSDFWSRRVRLAADTMDGMPG